MVFMSWIREVKTHFLFQLPITLIIGMLAFGFICTGMFHSDMQMESVNPSVVLATMENGQSCCGIDMSQHIESWKLFSTSIPQSSSSILILVVLSLALVTLLRNKVNHLLPDRTALSYRTIFRLSQNLFSINHLELAFARGVLNTKVY